MALTPRFNFLKLFLPDSLVSRLGEVLAAQRTKPRSVRGLGEVLAVQRTKPGSALGLGRVPSGVAVSAVVRDEFERSSPFAWQ